MMSRFLYSTFLATGLLLSATQIYAAPTDAGHIQVRAGVHDRFNRMVIDWKNPVKYTMKQNQGRVEIQFDHAAQLSLGHVTAVKPPFIRNLVAKNNDQGVFVTFDIPQNARVQAFWSGQKVAFDVLLMKNEKPVFADPSTAVAVPDTDEKKISQIISQGPQKPERITEITPTEKTDAPQENSASTAHGLQTLADQMKEQASGATAQQAQNSVAEKKTEQADKKEEGTVIRFRFLERTHLAVFERAGRLWVVFSPSVKKITPQVQGPLSRNLRNASKIETQNGTAFIFPLPDDVQGMEHIAVEQDGLNWEIWLQDSARHTATSGHMMLNTAGDGKNLTIDPDQQTYILPFEDKSVGDKIWVVPVLSPLLRVEYAQRMNSLRAVPSIVGGLFIPIRDHLNVQTKGTQFLIGDADGLLLSADADRFKSNNEEQQNNLFKLNIRDESFLQFLRGRDDIPFEEQRQRLERTLISHKDPKTRALYALNIARLYLGFGFGPEASGALELAESHLPNLKDTPDFIALKGMSAALSGQSEKALDILSQDQVKEAHASRLWRAYAWAQDKNWESAYQIFKNVNDGFQSYPTHLRTRLLLAAMESAVETGNMPEAQSFMRQLDGASLIKSQVMTRAYAEAMIVKDGNPDGALNLFEQIVQSNDKYYRVKADMNMIPIAIKNGSMTIPQAIERMEKLRYAWRGDRLEVSILRQLGHYYIENHDPIEAMTLWQQASKFAQQKEDQDALREDLQKSFNTIFVDGKHDNLKTLQILAIYERFKNLMPKGEDGIKAAFHLADQLQKVDLVDQADKILQDQLRHHASGADAVKIGTYLAKIRLIARDPAGALKALDESENDSVDEESGAHRTLLRIRALADNQQMEQAVMLLGYPSNPEGLSLRADIYWRQQAWGDAAADLQQLIDTHPEQTARNTQYTALLLRLAIAKALQNDELGLAQMAAQYGDLMTQAPEAKAFAVMTQAPGETSLADMDTIRSQVAQVELFEKFLKNF
jgi:tetratricopeptide (TPR) repeat protein